MNALTRLGMCVASAALAITLCAQAGLGQDVTCDPAKSAQDCFTTLRDKNVAAHAKADTAAVDSVANRLNAKPTGSEASAAGAQSAIKDFLPRLVTAVAIPGLSSDPKALDLRFNVQPADPVWRLPVSLQLAATPRQPALFAPLVSNLPAALRSAVADSITKTLDDFADLGLSGALNLETASWGRSFKVHAAEISSLTAALLGPDDAEVNAMNGQFARLIGHVTVTDPVRCAPFGARVNMPLNCFSDSDRLAVETLLGTLDRTITDVETHDRELLQRAHFDRLDELLNNQPQLNVTAEYNAREHLIGAEDYKATLRFEYSPANWNSARDFCRARGSATLSPDCVTAYLSQGGVLSSLDHGDRLWVAADLSHVSAYNFALAADSARVIQPSTLIFEPAAGYGRYVGSGGQNVRFDAELQYRYSKDQSVRQDRWLGTATLTQKVGDQSSAIFTLKWANKPEFLGDVDKKLRANVGLSYKLPQ